MRCGDALNACECDDQVPVSDVMDSMALPLEEVYLDDKCINECIHVGTLDCEPYRWFLIQDGLYLNDASISICDAFEPYVEPAQGGAAGG